MPEKPKGQFGTVSLPDEVVIQNDLETGAALPDVPLSAIDKWIIFPPDTWENIQNYIDDLIRVAEEKKSSFLPYLRSFKSHLELLKEQHETSKLQRLSE